MASSGAGDEEELKESGENSKGGGPGNGGGRRTLEGEAEDGLHGKARRQRGAWDGSVTWGSP